MQHQHTERLEVATTPDAYKAVEILIRNASFDELKNLTYCSNNGETTTDAYYTPVGIWPPIIGQYAYFDERPISKSVRHMPCAQNSGYEKPNATQYAGDQTHPAAPISDAAVVSGNTERTAHVYKFTTHEGAFLVTGYLSVEEQLDLFSECLNVYTQEPHTTNLHIDGRSSLRHNDNFKEWLSKLRWSCLGYQYDWTNRSYSRGPPFPEALYVLCQQIVKHIHIENFSPQAALVNVYRGSDRLRGHQDDVEHQNAPLVSLSLGLPCLFLLGYESREKPPVAVTLRSGDALILSRKSRFVYHGVPKLLYHHVPRDKATLNRAEALANEIKNARGLRRYADILTKVSSLTIPTESSREWCKLLKQPVRSTAQYEAIGELMKSCRINLSVRQIY